MKLASMLLAAALFCFSTWAWPSGSKDFPLGPDPVMTPGALCQRPDSYRYSQHIPYCERNVSYDQKEEVIRAYDQKFGYQIESMDRQDFKIDHFIPLCAGGSNDSTNLWPQHKSVYEITDPLEPLVCEKMENGTLTQAQAVEYIREAKTDLAKAPGIISKLSGGY